MKTKTLFFTCPSCKADVNNEIHNNKVECPECKATFEVSPDPLAPKEKGRVVLTEIK